MPIPNIHTFESDGNFKEKIVFEWEDPYIEELLEIEEEGTIPEIEQVEKEKVEKKKEERLEREKQISTSSQQHEFASSTAKAIGNIIGLTKDLINYAINTIPSSKNKSMKVQG